jgi:branched-chain amino acid aminotransferase
MASMRVVRMEIPMNFTMEYLEEQIVSLATLNSLSGSSRARITVFRNDGGYYLPPVNTVSFLIHTTGIEDISVYASLSAEIEVELFVDFMYPNMLLLKCS